MLPYADTSKIRVTQPYGILDNQYKAGKHPGIDLVSDNDKTIVPIKRGIVIRSKKFGKWGNYIVVHQEDDLFCVYAHLSKRYVKTGERVGIGQRIGIEGSTGNAYGSHLHIEIQKNYYDPYSTIDISEYLGIENKKGSLVLIKTPVIKAIDYLHSRGKITSPQYWKTHAKPGQIVSGENAAALLLKYENDLRGW